MKQGQRHTVDQHIAQAIFEKLGQGLLAIDEEGYIVLYNSAAEHFLNRPAAECIFQPYVDQFEDHFFGFSMQNALKHPIDPSHYEISLKNHNERRKELSVESFTLQGLIIIILTDLTEQHHLQQMAMRHDKLVELGEVAAMVAHEIRNPLGGIKGFASLLVKDLANQPDLQRMAENIVEGTDNLNCLVTAILNYTRPLAPSLETCDLAILADELKTLIEADPTFNANIHLKITHPHHPVCIQIDPQLLKSALLNLLMNGIQAMPDGGNLQLKIAEKPTQVVLTVADTGVGIPVENMEKLYTPFFTTRADGNGFGLAEVLKIVQAHGGTIDVESKVNSGTNFTIHLPKGKQ